MSLAVGERVAILSLPTVPHHFEPGSFSRSGFPRLRCHRLLVRYSQNSVISVGMPGTGRSSDPIAPVGCVRSHSRSTSAFPTIPPASAHAAWQAGRPVARCQTTPFASARISLPPGSPVLRPVRGGASPPPHQHVQPRPPHPQHHEHASAHAPCPGPQSADPQSRGQVPTTPQRTQNPTCIGG